MKLRTNDPRLTSYALGELDDAERAAVERTLAASPEAQAMVDDIRRTADELTAAMAAGAALDLTPGQRRAVEQAVARRSAAATAAAATTTIAAPAVLRFRPWRPVAAAAVLAFAACSAWWMVSMPAEQASRSATLANRKELKTPEALYGPRITNGATHRGFDARRLRDSVSDGPADARRKLEAMGYTGGALGSDAGLSDPALAAKLANAAPFVTLAEEFGVPVPMPDANSDGADDVAQFGPRRGRPLFTNAAQLNPAKTDHVLYPRNWLDLSSRRGNESSALRPNTVHSDEAPPLHARLSTNDESRIADETMRAVVERRTILERTRVPKERQEQKRRETVASLMQASNEELAQGRIAKAEELLRQVVYIDPTNVQALEQLDLVQKHGAELYARYNDKPFLGVAEAPLSTFSIDVDTASYTNIRRFLNNNQLPPPDAVRIEEMVNFFDYDYPPPAGEHPFAVYVDTTECPWTPQHRLMRVALKGREVPREQRPPTNLVFLIDVSGSMNDANKLPLVKDSLTLLAGELDGLDRVAIVVYAGASGLVLPSTGGDRTDAILAALDNLGAGGSTNGGQGIRLAYDVASANFIEGGANRVILATDGDFNVGITDQTELTRLIEESAATGVFLSVLGYGMGDLRDDTLETLADRGNGHYAYIDSLDEARRVLVDQVGGTLVTIAKDVKIQIEFNPLAVAAYRLIGYENRMLAARDFNDDAKDAGEIGAGHTVTALYEVVPAGVEWQAIEPAGVARVDSDDQTSSAGSPPGPLPYGRGSAGAIEEDGAEPSRPDLPEVDPLRYQAGLTPTTAGLSGETATVKLRYKQPDGDTSRLITYSLTDDGAPLDAAPGDLRFAAAVASFGMLLRHSPHAADWTLDAVQELAATALGDDPQGYRAEFLQLVEKARALNQP